MPKRTLAIVALIAVFALALVGAVAVSTAAPVSEADSSVSTLYQAAPNSLIAGDVPVCPPGVPPPCGL